MKTIQPLFYAVLFAMSLTAVPAFAQTAGAMMGKDCTDANMKSANDSMMMMKDATKKDAAMKEMNMAKDMMAKKDDKGCKMHLDKAMGMMK
jgi:hypothetical protein